MAGSVRTRSWRGRFQAPGATEAAACGYEAWGRGWQLGWECSHPPFSPQALHGSAAEHIGVPCDHGFSLLLGHLLHALCAKLSAQVLGSHILDILLQGFAHTPRGKFMNYGRQTSHISYRKRARELLMPLRLWDKEIQYRMLKDCGSTLRSFSAHPATLPA